MPIPKGVLDKLVSLDHQIIREGISDFWKGRLQNEYTVSDLDRFERLLTQIDGVAAMTEGQEVLRQLRRLVMSDIPRFVFGPLTKAGGKPSAVLVVCDGETARDPQWMLDLMQHLPGVKPIWIPAENDHWTPPNYADYSAICLIGRDHPSNPTTGLLPMEKGHSTLRFDMPPLTQRGGPISPDVHRIIQSWCGRQDNYYPTRQDPKIGNRGQFEERAEYALFQRFRVHYLGARIDVVRLAGPSSLGTAAVIMFATEMFSHPEKFDDYLERAGTLGALSPCSQIEVLLRVTGGVHKPRIRWEPKWDVEKIFINNSRNLVKKPAVIWVAKEGTLLARPEIRFDDDVIDPKDRYAEVVALCRAASEKRVVRLEDLVDLVKSGRFWLDGQIKWTSADQALGACREMQKGILKEVFHFSKQREAILDDAVNIVLEG
ncbi:MAG TPA: hypothetical protein VK752_06105 [Bryobacteraceae bacterium]|jgi:hypothetical protein|nr:hypothetical protein [Bryobacteraceae bacterium]